METKTKTIYDLNMHETITITESLKVKSITGTDIDVQKTYDVTRVPGGWIYAMDFPGVRQTSCVFIPFISKMNELDNQIKN